jgi:hypothetical protein
MISHCSSSSDSGTASGISRGGDPGSGVAGSQRECALQDSHVGRRRPVVFDRGGDLRVDRRGRRSANLLPEPLGDDLLGDFVVVEGTPGFPQNRFDRLSPGQIVWHACILHFQRGPFHRMRQQGASRLLRVGPCLNCVHRSKRKCIRQATTRGRCLSVSRLTCQT